MKKILLSVTAAAIALATVNAQAANGTVNFTGKIVQSTCVIASSDKDKAVFIGKYPTTAFSGINSVTASKGFSISLENCEAGSYSLRFDGPAAAGNNDLLAVNGGATGVGIEILDVNEKVVPLNQSAGSTTLPVQAVDAAGKTTFNLKARYKATAATVGAGDANATSSVTIEYK